MVEEIAPKKHIVKGNKERISSTSTDKKNPKTIEIARKFIK